MVQRKLKTTNFDIPNLLQIIQETPIKEKKAMVQRVRNMFSPAKSYYDLVTEKEKRQRRYKNKKSIKNIEQYLKYLERALGTNKMPKYKSILPLNGFEPQFNRDLWGMDPSFIDNQNCYAYAINQFRFNRKNKSVPGYDRGSPNVIGKDVIDCKVLTKEILTDLGEEAYSIDASKKCGENTYKMMLFITNDDTGMYSDFHFYRQDKDGTWSHKRGHAFEPTKLDASGRLITDPRKSDKHFKDGGNPGYNYSVYCGSFCVPLVIKYNV